MRVRPSPVIPPLRHRAASTEALLAAAVLATVTASVSAQLQFERLHKQGLPTLRDTTRALASGDLDGDGDRDLVVANWGSRLLYLNDGTGVFVDASTRLPSNYGWSESVVLGDVDGDGDLDVAFGNQRGGPRNLLLYLNDGTGRFADATATHMPQSSRDTFDMAVGDVDGDGDLDLVCAHLSVTYNNELDTLYLNDGTGRFTLTTGRLPGVSDCTTSVALGDLDADGDLDIVFGNSDYYGPSFTRQDQLYLNDGTGRFTRATATHLPVDNDRTEDLGLGDVDRDGDLDLVLGNRGQNRLYLNDGQGRFTDATSERMPVDSDFTTAMGLGDVDGDGDLDLVFGNYIDPSRLYLNDGTGRYVDATARMPVEPDPTQAVALDDVDGDGDPDLALGNSHSRWGAQNRLLHNDGTGRFTDATATRVPQRLDPTTAVALGDVDGDGDLDLVLACYGRLSGIGQNRLYRNDGTATFADVTATHMPPDADATSSVAMGDLDGDGDLDLVFGNGGSFAAAPNRLYLNDGTGRFVDASAGLPSAVERTRAVALSDVDGDGDLDLVAGNDGFARSGEQDRLLLNDGSARFTDVTASHLPSKEDKTTSLALGDLDGDGDLDLVVGNGYPASATGLQSRVYLNDGTGRYADVTGSSLPERRAVTVATSLGDLDGDGDLDLVFGNAWGQSRLYLNDGRAGFTDATVGNLPSLGLSTAATALGDVDSDGDLDLAVGSRDESQNHLLLNDGSALFTIATARLPAQDDDTRAAVFGDVDGDGDLDLVFGNSTSGDDPRPTELYLNLLRQIDAPLLPRVGFDYRLDAYARYGRAHPGDLAVPLLAPASGNFPLPPFGTFFLEPSSLVALPALAMPPSGRASLSLAVPNVPGIAGRHLFAQALVIQAPFAHLTNLTANVILR